MSVCLEKVGKHWFKWKPKLKQYFLNAVTNAF